MGKKGKKSKAQEEAERLQREEEERQAAEAELKRQEEDRITREEKQKKRREALAKARREELERVQKEVEASKADQQAESKGISTAREQDAENDTWGKWQACNPRPDPDREYELNAYLDTWGSEEEPLLTNAMTSVQYCDEIITDLLTVMSLAEANNDEPKIVLCKAFLKRLWEMSLGKLDCATAHILQHSDELTNPDNRNEVHLEEKCDSVKYAIWVNIIPKHFRMKQIRFNDIGIAIDVPKPLALVSIAMRVMYFPSDHELYERNCQVRSLGGCFHIELLQLPQQPKRVKGWTLRQVNDLTNSVCRLSYPLGSHGEGGHAVAAAGTAQPLKVQYHLPDDVLAPESNLRVGWWDTHNNTWNEEGITEIDYHPATRNLVFHTTKLCQLACIQEKHTDLPFVSWNITPMPKQWPDIEVHFSLETPRYVVTIAVREGECQLVAPDAPELASIRAVPMPPGQLLKRLAKAGINLTPTDTDADFAKFANGQPVCTKVPQLEAKLCYEVAHVATAMDVKASRWNQGIGSKQAAFLIRETCAFNGSEPDDEDYNTVLVEVDNELPAWHHRYVDPETAIGLKSSVVTKVSESDESFEVDHHENRPNTRIHLQNALTPDFWVAGMPTSRTPGACTPECLERMTETSIRFQQTLQEILFLTRPFSFT